MPFPFALVLLALTAEEIPAGAQLANEIRAADTTLFAAYFGPCDSSRVATMVTPDVEMYHDRGGALIGREAFMATYAKLCGARSAPDAWRSRRELVAGSFRVDPVPGYGAIEEGDHQFYERKGEGPEKLTGIAHFVQLWKWTPKGWQLSRILSYAHRAAAPAP